jgi:hypothetical protein
MPFTRRSRGSVNDQAYYLCRFPVEYALANKISHPRNVYLREADVLGHVDDWLAESPPKPRRASRADGTEELGPVLHEDGNVVAGAQAAGAEQLCDLVGLPVQLGEGRLVTVLAGELGQVPDSCFSCSISRCFIILPATERGREPTKVTDRGHL